MKRVLVTGAIGFIGFHLTKKLLEKGFTVVGIDNINSYYNVGLKYAKLPLLGIEEDFIWPNKTYQSNKYSNFKFIKLDITDRFNLEKLLERENFETVCHLAAQAGVQYSIIDPHTYISNNVTGFINIIDGCRRYKVKHFIYASSSSVYGNREDVPFKETDNVDHPISIYAASKKSNELIAHTYSHLYRLQTTGLRFFTVYGPWGRPDMAPFIFVKNINEEKPIIVYNEGHMERDFTYIDDIIEGLHKVIQGKNKGENYNIYNVGNSQPIHLLEFIHTIEKTLGKKAQIIFRSMREGDVIKTYSDTSKLQSDFGYKPSTSIKKGISNFIEWYYLYFKN